MSVTAISPRAAQALARLALRSAGHMIPAGCTVMLTTGVPGYEPSTHVHAVQPAQLEPAIAAALPWERPLEDGAA